MTLRLRPFLACILALLASVLLALAPVNAKPAPGEYQRISSAFFAGMVEDCPAEGVCFSTRRAEIQANLRTIGIVNFVAPSTWEGLALELVGAGAGKVLSLGGKTFIKIGDDFVEVADDFAANRGAGGFYDPRAWRQNYEDFYSGNVTSTTVPPYNAPNARLVGRRHPETGVVFDQRGFPIFDNHTAYDTRFTGTDFADASYQAQMRMATRDLRTTLETNPQLRSQFRPDQLQAIQSGNAKIPDYTWHHHQDSGRMQLVDQTVHKETGHIGGEAMTGGQ